MIGIIGSNGFVGQNLIKKLKKNKLILIENKTKIKSYHNNVIINKKDIGNVNLEKKYKNKIEIFINLASVYENLKKNDNYYIQNNIVDQINFFDFCKKINTKYFINIHTNLNLNLNRYSMTKDFYKRWISNFSKKMIVINLIPDFIYGFDDKRFTGNLLKKLFQDKNINLTKCNQIRNFICVDELCDHIEYLIKNINKINKNKNLNIYSNDTYSLKDYIFLITDYLEKTKKLKNVRKRLKFGSLPMRKFEDINQDFKKSSFFKMNKIYKKSIADNISEIIEKNY